MALAYVTDRDTANAAWRSIKASKVVAFDYETTGLDPHTDSVLLAQFMGEDGTCWVFNPRLFDPKPLLALLTDRARVTVAHNATFEYQFTLAKWGYRLGRVYCSKVAELVLTAGLNYDADLASTLERRTGAVLDKTLQKSFIGEDPATFEPTAEQLAYAASDVLVLPELRAVQVEALKEAGLVKTMALEMDALPVFAEMEYHGMRLDLGQHAATLVGYKSDAEHYGIQAAGVLDPFWQAVSERQRDADTAEHAALGERLAELLEPYRGRLPKDAPGALRAEVEDLRKRRTKCKPRPAAPINLNSQQQVLAALAESGVSLPNLQAETVEAAPGDNPALAAYAKYVKAQKIVGTYGDSMAAKVNALTGRLHGHYGQCVSTGRSSSSGPNMQNMPAAIRACFVPEPGHTYVVADFASMEPRIAAGLSGDKQFIADYEAGIDPYRALAVTIWPDRYKVWSDVPKDSNERKLCKIGLLAAIYGAGPFGLVAQGVPDEATAEAVLAGIATRYATMRGWVDDNGRDALHTGTATTANGRKRYFLRPGPCPRGFAAQRAWRKVCSRIERQAKNHPVQGTGADIAKRSMTLVHRALIGPDYVYEDGGNLYRARIVGFVHDEMIVEAPAPIAERVAEMVADSMKRAGAELVSGVDIPAEVHVTERWVK